MTNQLDSDLRMTLRERAANVPSTSISRLAGIDYQPRTRALRPPLAVGAAAGAAATAGTVAAVVSLSAGVSNAFAGWTPTPTAALPAQLAAAQAACKARSPVDGLPLKLSDTRGPFTFSVYADSNTSAVCITGPSFTSVSGSVSSAPVEVPAGQVQLSSSHLTNRDGQSYSFADGHTGAGVSGVTLILDDGTKVKATVANGWFVAWWPSAHDVKSADIATPSGVKTQAFHLGPDRTGGRIGGQSDGPVTGQAHGGRLGGTGASVGETSFGSISGPAGRAESSSSTR